jgi:uncharacterized protein (DUF4415 family)
MRRQIEIPTPEEDARINAGIAADPDSPELTEADFAAAVRVRDMPPDQLARMVPPEAARAELRRRGPQKAPRKAQITMRVDHDVAERLRAMGKGWQTRANDMLRDGVARAAKAEKRRAS